MSAYEKRDASIPSLVRFGAGLFTLVVFALVAMWLLFEYLARRPVARPVPSAVAAGPEKPPAPRLQVKPETDLEALRAAEDALLNSYGWIDPQGGIVRIPVDRAMDLIAERGLPARSPEGE